MDESHFLQGEQIIILWSQQIWSSLHNVYYSTHFQNSAYAKQKDFFLTQWKWMVVDPWWLGKFAWYTHGFLKASKLWLRQISPIRLLITKWITTWFVHGRSSIPQINPKDITACLSWEYSKFNILVTAHYLFWCINALLNLSEKLYSFVEVEIFVLIINHVQSYQWSRWIKNTVVLAPGEQVHLQQQRPRGFTKTGC